MKVLEIFERELTERDRFIDNLETELICFKKEYEKLKQEVEMLRKDLFELSKEYTNTK